MLLNAKTRQAKMLTELARNFESVLSPESIKTLVAGATEVLIGTPLLLLPKIEKLYTANRECYTDGKHFFLLEGEALKTFKTTSHQNDDSSLRVNKLYLRTEIGAWLDIRKDLI